MIDSLLIKSGHKKYDAVNPYYDASSAITKQSLLNPAGVNLLVIFPPWNNGGWFFRHLANRAVKQGWAVLHNEFAGEILQANTPAVINSFTTIANSISDKVNELSENNYGHVRLLGASLGNVSMSLTASSLARFDSAQFIVGGSDLAACTWDGTRTQHIRDQLSLADYSKEQLLQEWESIAPSLHAPAFRDKHVQALISETDEVIPSHYQQELADALASAGANINTTTTTLGHYASIAKFCISGTI